MRFPLCGWGDGCRKHCATVALYREGDAWYIVVSQQYDLYATAGPVRGIDFHSNQPLFVSGGDDYKIKVKHYL